MSQIEHQTALRRLIIQSKVISLSALIRDKRIGFAVIEKLNWFPRLAKGTYQDTPQL